MSEGHFHVHGPHDHAIEHAGHGVGGDGGFAARIAVTTAILATLGAMFGYEAGHTQNAALLFKNEAAIAKTAASNQWNYYQAKSNKQNLAELSVLLVGKNEQEKYRREVERYKREKDDIKTAADKLEAESREADHKSEGEMRIHERWAMATTLLQISIALSAIALLTRKKWLLVGVYGSAAVGVAVGVTGFLHH